MILLRLQRKMAKTNPQPIECSSLRINMRTRINRNVRFMRGISIVVVCWTINKWERYLFASGNRKRTKNNEANKKTGRNVYDFVMLYRAVFIPFLSLGRPKKRNQLDVRTHTIYVGFSICCLYMYVAQPHIAEK